MVIRNVADVEAVRMEGTRGLKIRFMLTEKEGAPTFNLRVVDLEPGGHSPRHAHDYEHEIFILEGRGEVLLEGAFRPVRACDAVLVAPNDEHQVRNVSPEPLRFICLVPQV